MQFHTVDQRKRAALRKPIDRFPDHVRDDDPDAGDLRQIPLLLFEGSAKLRFPQAQRAVFSSISETSRPERALPAPPAAECHKRRGAREPPAWSAPQPARPRAVRTERL